MIVLDGVWNAALSGWFFREEFAGRPAFLCVDEDTLQLVGRESGIAPVDALESLTTAVRPRVQERAPLETWTRAASGWRSSGFAGDPPFLSVLAITVLAGTMIGDSFDHSYYRRLNEMLGIAGAKMPKDFDSDIQQLWRCLNEWLNTALAGSRGVATATNAASSLSNVGWALSQTVLRPSDRAKLPFLFGALGVEPGQRVDGHLLLAQLRRSSWAGHGLSRHLRTVLENPLLKDLLANTLAKELAAWDGTLRDESGRLAAQLLLTYHQRSRRFEVAIRTPRDLAQMRLRSHENVDVVLGEAGGLELLPIEVSAALLDGGSARAVVSSSALSAEPNRREIRLVMPRLDIHLLVPNDGLARWVDVRPAVADHEHLVVVRSELARQAVVVMAGLSETPPRDAAVPCPSGWRAYMYLPTREQAIDGPFSVLSPRGTALSSLDGGLPIAARARIYLTAGPPDVALDLENPDAIPTVDGQPAATMTSSGLLRLSRLQLGHGEHRVDAGGTHFKFLLVDDYAIGPTQCSLAIALNAELSSSGRPWTIPAWRGARLVESQHDVMLSGASAKLSPQATARFPMVDNPQARAGGRHYALGAPGIAARIFPTAPSWLTELGGLSPHLVDLSPAASDLRFVPKWYLRITQVHATVVPAVAGAIGGDAAFNISDTVWAEVSGWLSKAACPSQYSAAWANWLAEAVRIEPAT